MYPEELKAGITPEYDQRGLRRVTHEFRPSPGCGTKELCQEIKASFLQQCPDDVLIIDTGTCEMLRSSKNRSLMAFVIGCGLTSLPA